jgi:hypothetical protein
VAGFAATKDASPGMLRSPWSVCVPIHTATLGHCDQAEQSLELLVGDIPKRKPINLQIKHAREHGTKKECARWMICQVG